MLVEQITWIQPLELLRELLKGLALLGAIRARHGPSLELFVCVEAVLTIQVLDERVEPTSVDLASVVVLEDADEFGCVGWTTLYPLSFSDAPFDPAGQETGEADHATPSDFVTIGS